MLNEDVIKINDDDVDLNRNNKLDLNPNGD